MRAAVVASVIATAVAMPIAQNLHDRAYYEEKFFNWLSEHKVEATSGEHFARMIANFANNDDIITQHNNQNLSYTLGHNKFSHMSLDEWREYVQLGVGRPEENLNNEIHEAPLDNSVMANSIDWRTSGAVTPVKDQGQCGSCWAFSTVGSIEGAYKIKRGSLVGFSEQMFVDCDNRKNGGSNKGCSGGWMDTAMDWANKWGGVCTENDYQYTSGKTKTEGTCNTSCKKNTNAKPVSHVNVKKNDDAAMMSALNVGPVAVAIQANQAAFQLYKSGVFSESCGTKLDHAVLAVGYGHDSASNKDYYIVKNSWGTGWGEAGYIRFEKGISQKEGQCGILSGPPVYPKLA